MKIAIICSSGGHLFQMYILKPWWQKYEVFWVTFNKKDAVSLLKEQKTYWAHYPTNRNLFNLIRNLFIAWIILKKEKPDLIVSDGAGVAVPFFWLSRFLKLKLYILKCMSELVVLLLQVNWFHNCSDEFLLQWEEEEILSEKE